MNRRIILLLATATWSAASRPVPVAAQAPQIATAIAITEGPAVDRAFSMSAPLQNCGR